MGRVVPPSQPISRQNAPIRRIGAPRGPRGRRSARAKLACARRLPCRRLFRDALLRAGHAAHSTRTRSEALAAWGAVGGERARVPMLPWPPAALPRASPPPS